MANFHNLRNGQLLDVNFYFNRNREIELIKNSIFFKKFVKKLIIN